MPSCLKVDAIVVGARSSLLSQRQVLEVQKEINAFYPITLIPLWMSTTGDMNLKVSLKGLENTNFFTQQIDESVLSGRCRIAIHSAKDLPNPLPPGLTIVALTKGVNPSDSLVFRPEESLSSLPRGSKIGTSSQRREKIIYDLRSDLQVVDIRGTIDRRLQLLFQKEIDALVVAEAALIRLDLLYLNRVLLPGPVATYQGQLAVVARSEDTLMASLFAPIDVRVASHSGSFA